MKFLTLFICFLIVVDTGNSKYNRILTLVNYYPSTSKTSDYLLYHIQWANYPINFFQTFDDADFIQYGGWIFHNNMDSNGNLIPGFENGFGRAKYNPRYANYMFNIKGTLGINYIVYWTNDEKEKNNSIQCNEGSVKLFVRAKLFFDFDLARKFYRSIDANESLKIPKAFVSPYGLISEKFGYVLPFDSDTLILKSSSQNPTFWKLITGNKEYLDNCSS